MRDSLGQIQNERLAECEVDGIKHSSQSGLTLSREIRLIYTAPGLLIIQPIPGPNAFKTGSP